MFDPTSWNIRLQRVRWLREFFDVAGGAPAWALAGIAGLSIMTALIGFFTEHPAAAIALAVLVALMGFVLFEGVHAWVRKETADHKLHISAEVPRIVHLEGDTCTIAVPYTLHNTAPFDLAYIEDDDDFLIEDIHATPTNHGAVAVLPGGMVIGKLSGPIKNVPVGKFSKVIGKITLRYGKSPANLNIRWFFAFEAYLPEKVSNDKLERGYIITRNDTEWITR